MFPVALRPQVIPQLSNMNNLIRLQHFIIGLWNITKSVIIVGALGELFALAAMVLAGIRELAVYVMALEGIIELDVFIVTGKVMKKTLLLEPAGIVVLHVMEQDM